MGLISEYVGDKAMRKVEAIETRKERRRKLGHASVNLERKWEPLKHLVEEYFRVPMLSFKKIIFIIFKLKYN